METTLEFQWKLRRPQAPTTPNRFKLYVERATSAGFGLHVGKIKFSAQNKECVPMRLIVRIILPVYILYIMHTKKYTDNRKNL